jgi:hypothetical protein
VVYLPSGGPNDLDLSEASGRFGVKWFNPRAGGQLETGSVQTAAGGGKASLGQPPHDAGEDWVVVVKRQGS